MDRAAKQRENIPPPSPPGSELQVSIGRVTVPTSSVSPPPSQPLPVVALGSSNSRNASSGSGGNTTADKLVSGDVSGSDERHRDNEAEVGTRERPACGDGNFTSSVSRFAASFDNTCVAFCVFICSPHTFHYVCVSHCVCVCQCFFFPVRKFFKITVFGNRSVELSRNGCAAPTFGSKTVRKLSKRVEVGQLLVFRARDF